MANLAELINNPLKVQGRDIVLIPDVVGPVPVSEQHQYVELEPATNTCPTISVREADIEDVRERFPELAVFGLWQVLVKSEIISFRQPLHVVKVNEYDGYYLHCDLGRAEFSGVYEAGFFAADADFDLAEANEVSPSLDQFVVPLQEAKLASELLAERKLRSRRSWRNLVVASAWILVMAFGLDFALEKVYHHEQAQLQSKTAMLESLRSGLNQLRNTRLTEVPNDIETIKKLALLWAAFPQINSVGINSFNRKKLTFSLVDTGIDPKVKLKWLETKYDPQGFWTVSFKNPQSG